MLTRLREAARWRARAARWNLRYFPGKLTAWLAFRRAISGYRVLGEEELRATRTSDTVFIFGSGHSLNALTADDWQRIAAHNTIGFNWFVHQQFVRCDYQLVREVAASDLDRRVWTRALGEYFALLRANPNFDRAVMLIQTGFSATNGNRAIGLRLVPTDRPVFLWRSCDQPAPTRSFADGLAHRHGTLCEAVNFAFLMGWKRIVLAGVDLYDRRYFWLRADEPRPEDPEIDQPHRTNEGGIVEELGRWRDDLARSGVELFVYNPRSLLTRTLPVWNAKTS